MAAAFALMTQCSYGVVVSITGSSISDTDAAARARAAAFPAVGQYDGCSGILIAPNKVLTAAHCVDDNADGIVDASLNPVGQTFRLGQDVGSPDFSASISSVVINPLWHQAGAMNRRERYDLAIITLSTNITGVAPMSLSHRNAVGMQASLVGFGTNGDGGGSASPTAFDNFRRSVTNTIDRLDSLSGTGALQLDFDNGNAINNTIGSGSATPTAFEGAVFSGDSGGLLAVDFGYGNGNTIVGITSAVGNPRSTTSSDELSGVYGSIAEFAPVADAQNRSWLEANGVTFTPEPSSASLLLLGLTTITLRRRR